MEEEKDEFNININFFNRDGNSKEFGEDINNKYS